MGGFLIPSPPTKSHFGQRRAATDHRAGDKSLGFYLRFHLSTSAFIVRAALTSQEFAGGRWVSRGGHDSGLSNACMIFNLGTLQLSYLKTVACSAFPPNRRHK